MAGQRTQQCLNIASFSTEFLNVSQVLKTYESPELGYVQRPTQWATPI